MSDIETVAETQASNPESCGRGLPVLSRGAWVETSGSTHRIVLFLFFASALRTTLHEG